MQPTEETIQRAAKSWGIDLPTFREIVSLEGHSEEEVKMWAGFCEILKKRDSPEYTELMRLIALSTGNLEGGNYDTKGEIPNTLRQI